MAVAGSSLVAASTNSTGTANNTNHLNGHSSNGPKKMATRKTATYRHAVAVHSQVQHSCLSRDSTKATSFIGFRNLMVVVLGENIVFNYMDDYANSQ
jgi:diacylglycerol O-acyltransferase-1